ncbi:hypothetical protein D0W47_03275 [Campylobacter coli]|nr:hypothetical protein [Campylobacter coli]
MAGEFLMIYDAIDVNKIKKLSNLSDEAIKSSLANEFLELVSGFNNISKKKFKREFAEFLFEKGVGGKIKCRKRKIKCRIFATNYLSFNLKLKL